MRSLYRLLPPQCKLTIKDIWFNMPDNMHIVVWKLRTNQSKYSNAEESWTPGTL